MMDSNKPFISVVMPVYGVEKHLKQAIESVLRQSFQDYELILVDDCSPDRCPIICDEYADRYQKITVIHHEVNQGLSQARNTGLKKANGRYIWFMDSDDYVDDYLFQKVYESVAQNPAQVVVFGLVEEYYDEKDNLHHTHTVKMAKQYLKEKQQVRDVIIDLEMKTLYGYAWNKFYNLGYLKETGLTYENVTLIEDILFNVKLFMEISSLNILDIAPYHYNKRMDNSLTAKFVPDYYQLHRKRIELIYEQHIYWGICTPKVMRDLGVLYTRYIFSALQRNCDKRAKMTFKQRKQWIRGIFKDPLFEAVIPYSSADSGILRIMGSLLKNKRELGCIMLGRIIFVVKNYLPMVFAAIKQKR